MLQQFNPPKKYVMGHGLCEMASVKAPKTSVSLSVDRP